MAITKAKKEGMLTDYTELIGKSQAVFIAQYGGLKMPELDKVRGQIRGAGARAGRLCAAASRLGFAGAGV